MIDLAIIGSRIRELRHKNGLTQSEFAKILSVSFQAVSSWERGIAPPDIENLMNIASCFGVLVDTLLSPETEDLYVGIDGGGTKTEFVAVTSSGNVLKRIIKSGSNPNDAGLVETKRIIVSGINDILIEYPRVKSVFCGIAGSSAGNYAEKLTSSLKKLFAQTVIKVMNDAFCLFAVAEEADMALISGTGSVAFIKTDDGYKRIGGWGHLFDSAGSAYDIGRAAIRTALAEEDAHKKPSLITEMLRERMKTATVWEHINELYNGGKAYIASFASAVFDAYRKGDNCAACIIDENAKALAELLNKGIKLYNAAPIAVASGGIFEHYSDIMTLHIKKYSDTKLIISDMPPVYGAARMACEIASCKKSDSFCQNFKKTYGEFKK